MDAYLANEHFHEGPKIIHGALMWYLQKKKKKSVFLTSYCSPSLGGTSPCATIKGPNSLAFVLRRLWSSAHHPGAAGPGEPEQDEPLGMEQEGQLQICRLHTPKQGLWGETSG